jgi:hypothetical protein
MADGRWQMESLISDPPFPIFHFPLPAAARSGDGGSPGAATRARALGGAGRSSVGSASGRRRRRARWPIGRRSGVRRWRTVGGPIRLAPARLAHRRPVRLAASRLAHGRASKVSARDGIPVRGRGAFRSRSVAILAAIRRQVAASARIAAQRARDRVGGADRGFSAPRSRAFDGSVLRLVHRAILRARYRAGDLSRIGLRGRIGGDASAGTDDRP